MIHWMRLSISEMVTADYPVIWEGKGASPKRLEES